MRITLGAVLSFLFLADMVFVSCSTCTIDRTNPKDQYNNNSVLISAQSQENQVNSFVKSNLTIKQRDSIKARTQFGRKDVKSSTVMADDSIYFKEGKIRVSHKPGSNLKKNNTYSKK